MGDINLTRRFEMYFAEHPEIKEAIESMQTEYAAMQETVASTEQTVEAQARRITALENQVANLGGVSDQ